MPEQFKVQLWLIREPLELHPETEQYWLGLLSEAERERLQRFVRPEDRHRYLLGRALCRTVLAGRLNISPEKLRITVDPNGKPYLAGGRHQPQFNLSHTQGMITLAVCDTAEVGVDVEDCSRSLDLPALSQRYFSEAENAAVAGLQGDQQRECFFACWTLKEAFLKGHGLGLRVALDSFSFGIDALATSDERITLDCRPELADNSAWQFRRFSDGPHRIALAVNCGAADLKLELIREFPSLE